MIERRILCHRLFFALHPPPMLARQIAASADWFGLEGRPLRPDHLHVTLDISEDFGRFPDELAGRLVALGAAIAVAPFTMLLDRAVGSARSVALRPRGRIAGLARLQQAIAAARDRAGIAGRAGYAFSPHLTLGYREGAPFVRPIDPIRWPVDAFALVHSRVGRTEHAVLGRWALHGAEQRDLFGAEPQRAISPVAT